MSVPVWVPGTPCCCDTLQQVNKPGLTEDSPKDGCFLSLSSQSITCCCLNRQNRWTKRGLAMVPTKFGISFTAAFLNQVCYWTPPSSQVSIKSRIFENVPHSTVDSTGWSSGPHLHRWFCIVDSWWNRNGTRSPHQDGPGMNSWMFHPETVLINLVFEVNGSCGSRLLLEFLESPAPKSTSPRPAPTRSPTPAPLRPLPPLTSMVPLFRTPARSWWSDCNLTRLGTPKDPGRTGWAVEPRVLQFHKSNFKS